MQEFQITEDKLSILYPPLPQQTLIITNKINEGGNNQKLILFNLGKAISGEPIITGTIQLPNPPIIAGITMKKIIKNHGQ